MKIKIILILLLLLPPLFILAGDYLIHCRVEVNSSAVSFVEISFNPGEGCTSNDFQSFHHMTDGSIKETISTPDSSPYGVLDFGKFGCCDDNIQ